MKAFHIAPEENLTLRQVEDLTRNGNEITLTPHVGNIWSQNMAVVDLGVKVVAYEGNCHVRDTDEYPGHLRKDNSLTDLVDEQRAVMSTHLQFRPGLDIPYLRERDLGKTPAQVHYNAMRRVLPPDQLVLSAEYFYTAEPEIQEMLLYLAQHHHIFNRAVDLDGIVTTVAAWDKDPVRLVNDFMALKHAQIHSVMTGEKPQVEGPLASNKLNIMMLGIKAFLEKRRRGALSPDEQKKFTAYAVSGRSMINYTKDKNFQEEIRLMYDVLRQKFTYLPEELELKMLPGSNLRFVTAPNESPFELIKAIGVQNMRIDDAQNKVRTSTDHEKKAAIQVTNGLRSDLNKLIDELWADAPWNRFYSQHDALCNGGRTVVPDEIKGMTFKKLGIVATPKVK